MCGSHLLRRSLLALALLVAWGVTATHDVRAAAGKPDNLIERLLGRTALRFETRGDSLAFGPVRLRDYVANVDVRPTGAGRRRTHVRLRAAELALAGDDEAAGSVFGNVVVDAWLGPRLRVEITVRDPLPIVIRLQGQGSLEAGRVTVRRFALIYPGASWRLEEGAPAAKVRWGAQRLAIEGLRLRAGRQRLALDLRRAQTLRAELAVEALDLARLPVLSRRFGLSGRLDLTVALVAGNAVDAKAGVNGLIVAGTPLGDWQIRVHDDRDARAEVVAEAAGGLAQRLRLSLMADIDLASWLTTQTHAPLPALADARFEASLEVERLPLARAWVWSGLPVVAERPPEGWLSSTATVTGSLRDPRGQLRVELEHLRGIADARAGRFGLADQVPRHLGLALAVDARGARGDLRVEQSEPGGRARLATLSFVLDWPLARRARLANVWQATARAQLALGPLRLVARSRPGDATPAVATKLTAALRMQGELATPAIDLDARLEGLTVAGRDLGRISVRGLARARSFGLSARYASPLGGGARLSASFAQTLSLRELGAGRVRWGQLPVSLDFAVEALELALLAPFIPAVDELAGRVAGRGQWRGTLAEPRLSGRLVARDVEFLTEGLGKIEGGRLDVTADAQGLRLDSLRFAASGGDGLVRGSLLRGVRGGWQLRFATRFDDLPVWLSGRELGRLTLVADGAGTLDARELRVDPLTIERLVFEHGRQLPPEVQDLDRPDDIVLLRGGVPVDVRGRRLKPRREAEQAAARPSVIVVRPRAPRNLWLRGPDTQVELGLSETFELRKADAVTVSGTVEVLRGTGRVFGRRFEIERKSRAEFFGEAGNPILDVTLQHRNERADVMIYVRLSGPLEEPQLSFSSDPPYSDTELITLLLTGRLETPEGGTPRVDQQSAMLSIAGGLLASQLQKALRQRLPLDVLEIGTGGVEAGTYLGDNFYLGYVRRLYLPITSYENVNAVRLEYQLSSRWLLEGEYGDANRISLDLLWSRRY